jgi:hypothetical protein
VSIYLHQGTTTTAGGIYKFTATHTSTGVCKIRFGTTTVGGEFGESPWTDNTTPILTGRATTATTYGALQFGNVGPAAAYFDNVSLKPILTSTLYATVDAGTANVLASADLVVTAGTQAGLVVSYADTNNLVLAYHDGTNAKLDKCVSTTIISGATLNGNFSTTDNWTLATGVTIADGKLQVRGPAIYASAAYQNSLLTVGKRYQYSFTVSNNVVGTSLGLQEGANTTILATTDNGVYSGVYTSVVGGALRFKSFTGTDTCDIDDVVLIDLQTWTSVISAAATYSANATLRVIKDGTSYSLYYNNAKVGSTATISDAALISNTKHGLFSTYSGNTLDNFTVYARGTGGEYDGVLNKYSAANPTGDALACVLTVTPPTNGTISPGTTSVTHGGSQAFTITPAAGYTLDTLKVDGVKVDSTTSYTFTGLNKNHAISATFAVVVVPQDTTNFYVKSMGMTPMVGTPQILRGQHLPS